ncbi:polysaccharide deacetylase family protein [Levilactobacillus bambusae]|uniref:Polysaccharide deacetylase n=1 Tax=Levilactobacillus bambusae TaxID=2024736 RepID=A0A2V1N007_9LACO|nr:polysaccharide deacetylase family protein [Levilactobacillus bambusae]PWG00402.1 polysaccharide deacetylase [Levilactobacillus bambusae]
MKKRKVIVGLLLILMGIGGLSGCQSRTKTGQSSQSSAVSQKKRAPAKVKWQPVQNAVKIPILMYHSISSGNDLRVPASQFQQEMAYLHKHHYYTLTTAEAIRAFKTNSLPAKKVVWVTLDDAYRDNLTKGLPILQRNHVHATINVITDYTTHKNHLSLRDMERMKKTGWVDFQSHTVQHLDLNELSDAQQKTELVQSKRWLDEKLHQDTQMICYPAGRANDATAKLAKQAGYQIGLTTAPGMGSVKDQGWYNLKRQRVTPGMTTTAFASLLS